MNFKNLLLLTAFIAAGSPTFAQYASDALLFSQFQQGGSARFKAMGNAQIAVGGDIGSLSSNPAGLGLFTKSEFNFSAYFSNREVESEYIGQSATAQKDRLGVDQIGGVIYSPTSRTKGTDLKTGWLSINYGVSYNKTNSFNSTTDYAATNPSSSIADFFADEATMLGIDGSALAEMAYNNFLIEFDEAGNTGYFPTTSLNNNQRNLVFNTGSQSEVNFGLGANHSNKLYLGASIAIASVDYNSDREFNEQGNNQTFEGQNPEFAGGTYDLDFNTNQVTTGTGFNAKIGMIYRATDAVRVGFSFISPTWYQITDSYAEALDTRYTRANGSAIEPYTNQPEIYDLDYTLRTPLRVNGGISAIINKQGLLSADVEYADYSSVNFESNDQITDQNTNNDIRDSYKAAVNFRVGGEYKISNMMLRAGYNLIGNPYQNIEVSTDILSAGIGYRTNLLYLDLTYQNATFNGTSTPYVISQNYADYQITGAGEVANLKNTSNTVFLTIGARF